VLYPKEAYRLIDDLKIAQNARAQKTEAFVELSGTPWPVGTRTKQSVSSRQVWHRLGSDRT
jgi:hypothetical protein